VGSVFTGFLSLLPSSTGLQLPLQFYAGFCVPFANAFGHSYVANHAKKKINQFDKNKSVSVREETFVKNFLNLKD